MIILKNTFKNFIKNKALKALFLFFLLFFTTVIPESILAQQNFYKKRTLYNLRIRENNVYKGAIYREIRETFSYKGKISIQEARAQGWLSYDVGDSGLIYGEVFSGNGWFFEEMKTGGSDVVKKIDTIVKGSYLVAPDGIEKRLPASKGTTVDTFPVMINFPVIPHISELEEATTPAVWTASGDFYTDPLKKGIFTKIDFICQYKDGGETTYLGRPCRLITAQYATRYKQGDDPSGDSELLGAMGSHRIKIYLRLDDGAPFFIQDNIEETYQYSGLARSVKGFSHTWYTDIIPMKKQTVKTDIEKAIAESTLDTETIKVEEKDDGVSLTLNSLHFVPDSPQLLPGEDKKIAIISSILKKIPNRSFLVTGHTADIGTSESQVKLSIERANKIAELLKASGIAPDRIIFTGKGGSEPVGDNATEEGRALNRRVEILVLED